MRHAVGLIFALAALVALVGCGGDGSSTSKPSATGKSSGKSTKSTSAKSDDDVVVTQEGWGNLVGKFVYDGTPPKPSPLVINKDAEVCGKFNLADESLVVGEDGGIANVVIYVRTKKVDVHPDWEPKDLMMIDNKNCRFEPHILTMTLSDTFTVHNSDPIAHNSNVQPLGDKGLNPLIEPGGKIEHQFSREQSIPTTVSCNIHPWMKGYVLPRENPYATVTAADGTFKIENLPAGELEFQVWQEKAGYLVAQPDWDRGRFSMVIEPDKDNDLGTVKVSASAFEEK